MVDSRSNSAFADETLGTFTVAIEAAPPTAALTPVATRTTSAAVDLEVTYFDASGIDVATLGGSDLLITGPNGFSRAATLVSTGLTNGSPRVVRYRIAPASGSFSAGDQGTYTVLLVAGQVGDVNGTANSSEGLGTFSVGLDSTPPTAALVAVPTLRRPGQVDLTVTFSDTSGVSAATLKGATC